MILTVRMANPIYYMKDSYASYVDVPEYHEYTGEVLPNPKWVGKDSFCLRSGSGRYDFRVLKKDNIIHGWLHR